MATDSHRGGFAVSHRVNRIIITILLAILAGCGQENDGYVYDPYSDNYGYGYQFDIQGFSGVRLRYKPTVNDGDWLADISRYEDAFIQTKLCVESFSGIQIQTDGPLVIIVQQSSLDPFNGFTLFDTKTILMENPDNLTTPSMFNSLLNHEVVHFLLAVSGFPDDLNAEHASPLFNACGQIIS